MKTFWKLIKAIALGSLGILLPILLLYALLVEVLDLLVAFATPIADLILPESVGDVIHAPVVVAVLLGASILLGLAARSNAGRHVGRSLERNVLERVPAYAAVKAIGRSLIATSANESFVPIVIGAGNGSATIGYWVEEVDGDRIVVLEPWAPTPFAGSVKIVPCNQVRRLAACRT